MSLSQPLPRRYIPSRPGAKMGPGRWDKGQPCLWEWTRSLTGYLRYERIMKGRRGCPLQVYAGPPAGELGSVLLGASCGERMRGRL